MSKHIACNLRVITFKMVLHQITHRHRLSFSCSADERHVSCNHQQAEELDPRHPSNSITARKVSKWLQHGPVRKAGRKYNTNFEQQVLDELVFTTIENGGSQASIVANSATHMSSSCKQPKVQAREEYACARRTTNLLLCC